MLPKKVKEIIERINDWTKKAEHWERILNRTSVLVAVVTFISWALQREGKYQKYGEPANEIIDKMHLACCILIAALQVTFWCVKSVSSESEKVAKAIKKLTIDDLNSIDGLNLRFRDRNRNMFLFEYTDYFSAIPKFEQESGHANFFDEHYFLKQYFGYHKVTHEIIAKISRNSEIVESTIFMRMQNRNHYNDHNSQINLTDTTSERANTLYLHSLSLTFKYFEEKFPVIFFMNGFCKHAANSLCTNDGTYKDILIYARLGINEEDYARILLAIGFECETESYNDLGSRTYVLNFGKKQDNVFVRKIFEFMEGGDIEKFSNILN